MNNLVILTGPTAVGKTDTSIALAKAINGEIISADSIQIYKKMNIGSAKITQEEMDGVNHYLIDCLEPDEEFNVHIFQKMAKDAINKIQEKGKIPIIVGGTGFYIQSILYDIKFDETETAYEYREHLEELAEKHGNEYIHNMLKEVDYESACNIHFNNRKRVIRALEYYNETGQKISQHNNEQKQNESPYNFKYFVLNDDRDALYSRINKRVDIMLNQGLVDEVKSLLNSGYHKDLVSMQGIGYKEVVDYLENNIDYDEMVELIKKNTRHFAKRQLTWFRRERDVTHVYWNEFNHNKDEVLNYILNELKNKGIIE